MRKIFILLVLLSLIYGKVLTASFTIYKDDKVILDHLFISEKGHVTERETGDYYIMLYDKDGNLLSTSRFQVSFLFMYDTPSGGGSKEMDSQYITTTVEYYSSASKLVVKHGDKTIFEQDLEPLKGTCNYNEICEAGETSFSCFSDCHESAPLSKCALTGVCGDCDYGISNDPDCKIPGSNGIGCCSSSIILTVLFSLLIAEAQHFNVFPPKKAL